MEILLAVFRSRTQTGVFADGMKRAGRCCTVVATPARAGVGCGVSAKILRGDMPFARRLILQYRLNGFEGFFIVKTVRGKTSVIRLN